MTSHIAIRSKAPASKTMSQKEIFKKIEDAKVGSRKKMTWFTSDQVDIMQQLKAFEPELSDSKIIRKAMDLYLRMHIVRSGQSNKQKSA